MMKIRAILLLTVFLVSCSWEDDPPLPTKTEQTLFIYLPWSTDLTDAFETNLRDFETAMKSDILGNNRVIVFFSSSPTEATLFELKYKNGKTARKTIRSYQNPAFTTAEGITAILNDVVSTAPADRYAMTVGCHGMGWLPVTPGARGEAEKMHWDHEGVPQTRYFGGRTSQYQTEVTTFAEGIAGAGLKMEYILFDDCYMSSVEVAYDLKDVTNHLIACPTEVMSYGFPYHIVAPHLLTNNYSGICDGFHEFYETYEYPYGTIALTDCTEIERLAGIMREINGRFTFDHQMLGTLQRMDGYGPVIFFDCRDYVRRLCGDPDLLAEFEAQLERTVPEKYRLHTPRFYSRSMGTIAINTYSGITTSDPSIHTRAATDKTRTAWYDATH